MRGHIIHSTKLSTPPLAATTSLASGEYHIEQNNHSIQFAFKGPEEAGKLVFEVIRKLVHSLLKIKKKLSNFQIQLSFLLSLCPY